MKTNCLILLCLLLAAGCQPSSVSDRASGNGAPERNVLVMVSDDHGLDMGAYGNEVIRTPNLDALAADGVLFRYAFATTASCSASRSVIMSGLHNHRTGQYGHMHDYAHFISFDHIRSLPVMMSEGGYRTAIIGKFHVAPESVYHFEQVIPGNTRNPVQMADNTVDFVTADDHRPFFLYFATSDPHRGGGVVESSPGPYKPDRFGNTDGPIEGVETQLYSPDEVVVPPFLPDSPPTRRELAQYYQSVSRVDDGVGRMLEVLAEAGVYDKTLIIYMSDHGAAFPGAKTTVYEPGLRSPLIVRNPYDNRPGHVNNAMISWVDVTPTILDFAGIDPPVYDNHIGISRLTDHMPDTHGPHGRSFLPVLSEEETAGWDEIYASHTFHEIQMYYPMRVVRDREYKLIWNIAGGLSYPHATDLWDAATWQHAYRQGPETMFGVRTVDEYLHRPEFELYDMQNDPRESNNLADDPEFADVLDAYKEKIKDFQKRTLDPWFLKWSYR